MADSVRFGWLLIVAAVVAAAMPSIARAQPPPELPTGWTVHVITADGRTEKGIVVDVTAATLNIIIREQLTSIRVADIRQIDRDVRDPLRDGFWKGAIIGGAVGSGVLLVTRSCYVVKCAGLMSRAFAVGAGVASGVGVGGAIGMVVDYENHARLQIYPKPAAVKPVRLLPLLSPGTLGVAAAIRW